MAKDNRPRTLCGDEKNSPAIGCVNAFPISDYLDVDYKSRQRGLSGTGKASPEMSSGTAFTWLLQSGLAAFVPELLAARHLAGLPPGDAPLCDLLAPGAGVPIDGSDAPCKLFQSFPSAVRHVLRMQPVRPPFAGNQSSKFDTLDQLIKTAEWSEKIGQKVSLCHC